MHITPAARRDAPPADACILPRFWRRGAGRGMNKGRANRPTGSPSPTSAPAARRLSEVERYTATNRSRPCGAAVGRVSGSHLGVRRMRRGRPRQRPGGEDIPAAIPAVHVRPATRRERDSIDDGRTTSRVSSDWQPAGSRGRRSRPARAGDSATLPAGDYPGVAASAWIMA